MKKLVLLFVLIFAIIIGLSFLWHSRNPSEDQAEKEEPLMQSPTHSVRINEDTVKNAVDNPNADPSADPNIYTCESDDDCILVSVGNCCEFVSVNERYKDQVDFVPMMCMRVCPNEAAVCRDNACKITTFNQLEIK